MAHDERVLKVETEDGHGFELIDVGPEDAPALLFLPGMGISARNLIAFGRALAQQDLRLLIHEWRGNGSSTLRARRGVDWGYTELLDFDLQAALDVALSACGPSPLWLGGHSLGSQLACLAAAHRPGSVGGIVIVAGGSPYWRSFPIPTRYGLLGMLHLLPAIGRTFGVYPGRRVGFAGTEARQVMIDWARTGRSGRYAWGTPERDEEPLLASLSLPVHTVSMAHDWFVPDESTRWLTAKLPHCPVRQTRIGDGDSPERIDHFNWMQQPDATAAVIARTIREQLNPAEDPRIVDRSA